MDLIGEIAQFIESIPCGGVSFNALRHSGLPQHLYLHDLRTALVPHALLGAAESEMEPKCYEDLADVGDKNNIRIVQVWEDLWRTKREVVESRIRSIIGKTRRVYARKTDVSAISRAESDLFLNDNHLMGTTTARYRYCLQHNGVPMAVATFSKPRNIHRDQSVYRSYEMIRYCSALNTTVTGGLDKLLQHFIRELAPEHIMTYVDRDWGSSATYTKLGFEAVAKTHPTAFWIEPDTYNRIFPGKWKSYISNSALPWAEKDKPEDVFKAGGFLRAYNSGNIKYVRFLKV